MSKMIEGRSAVLKVRAAKDSMIVRLNGARVQDFAGGTDRDWDFRIPPGLSTLSLELTSFRGHAHFAWSLVVDGTVVDDTGDDYGPTGAEPGTQWSVLYVLANIDGDTRLRPKS